MSLCRISCDSAAQAQIMITIIRILAFAASFRIISGLAVVVTGAAGFLGSEIAHQLAESGAHVVAVVRDASRVSHLAESQMRVVECDLSAKDGQAQFQDILETVGDEHFVINTAAVFKRDFADAELELVQPTIAIAENVALACAVCGSKRLVHTSSMAAVRDPRQAPRFGDAYTSADWNEMSQRDGAWPEPYQFSKAESERKIWWISKETNLDVVVLCPSMIYGPPRSVTASAAAVSVVDVIKFLNGRSKVQSRLICDVRDVAAAHIKSLTAEVPRRESNGDYPGRYIVGPEARIAAVDLSEAIRGDTALAANFPLNLMVPDTDFRPAIPIGQMEVDVDKTRADLGAEFRPPLETVLDMARALSS